MSGIKWLSLCAAAFLSCNFFLCSVSTAQSTSFKDVTSKLDANGEFYFYMSTDKASENLLKKLNEIKGLVNKQSFPDMSDENLSTAMSGFDFASSLIKGSGLSELKGIGISSIYDGKNDFNRGKMIFFHRKNEDKGLIWKLFGKEPHKLDSLKLLPANTVFAGFGETDLGIFWSWLKAEVNKSNIPQMKDAFSKFENELKEKNGIDLSVLLASLENNSGFILTLDNTKKTIIPGKVPIEIPEPSLALVVYVKDNNLFDLLKKKIPSMPKNDGNKEVQKVQIIFGLPLPVRFQPMMARTENMLILASNEDIIDSIISAKKNGNGLVATEEFKKLAVNIPDTGNAYKYVSSKFSETIQDIQTKIAENENNPFAKIMNIFQKKTFLFSVCRNTDEGFEVTANSSMNIGTAFVTQVSIAPMAIAAGMMLPALNSAREKAKRISCASNLKQIGLALKQYSMDYDDKFPEANGAAGLEVLRKNDYLTDTKVYVCPSSSLQAGKPGTPLTETTVSYIYLGGLTEKDSPDMPIAFDKPGNHKDYINVLFLDGHVQGFPIRGATPEKVIDYVNSIYKYKPEEYRKLKDKVLIKAE